MSKTIFITLSNRAVFRNLFFFPESVFDLLRCHLGGTNGIRVVLLIPEKDRRKYEALLGQGRGAWYAIEYISVPLSKTWIERLCYFFYSYLIYTGTTRLLATIAMRPDEPPAGGRRWLAGLKWLIAHTFGKSEFVKGVVVPRLFARVFRNRPFEKVYERYQPSLVFAAHLYGWFDQHCLAEARRRAVPTIGMAAGWDHLDKYYLPFRVDTLLVQSEEIREAAIRHQGYRSSQISLVGYPHFDFIRNSGYRRRREEVLQTLGFPPDAKYVVYVSGSSYCPDEPEIIEQILAWAEEGRFSAPLYCVLRPYPGGRNKDAGVDEIKFGRFRDHPRVYIYEKEFWGDVEKSTHFLNILRHADAVLSVYNTVALEAAVYDRPLVAPAFDGRHRRSFHRSVRRFAMMDHFQHVLSLGAMAVAHNFEELFQLLERFFTDPAYLGRERELMRERICGPLDGKVSERIVGVLVQKMKR